MQCINKTLTVIPSSLSNRMKRSDCGEKPLKVKLCSTQCCKKYNAVQSTYACDVYLVLFSRLILIIVKCDRYEQID